MAKLFSIPSIPSWLKGWPFLPRNEPLLANESELMKGTVMVDPSKIMQSWLNTPYNPEILVSRKGMGIFDNMKRDEQVKACLQFKKAAVLSAGWEVTPPGDIDSEWEPLKFIEAMFTHFPGGWNAALKKILLGVEYGFSVTEKIYGEATWTPGKVALKKMVSIKPHYIDFRQLPTGELVEVTQQAVLGGNAIPTPIPVDKCVIYSHNMEFENYYGMSELVPAYRPWWTKDNSYKWFAMYLERHGMAPVFGMYNQQAYQGGQLDELKKIIQNIRNSTMGLIPRNVPDDFEFYSQQVSAQSRDIFLSAFQRFDSDIGHSLLVPALIGATSDNAGKGESATGSYARSQTHFDLFMVAIQDLQKVIAQVVNEQIIKQACDLNFSEQELRSPPRKEKLDPTPKPAFPRPEQQNFFEDSEIEDAEEDEEMEQHELVNYPEFKFLPMNNEVRMEVYTLWKTLVDGKIVNRIPEDEIHIRSAFGFPENDNPEVQEIEPPPIPGMDGGFGGPADAEGEPVGKKVPEEKQTKEMKEYVQEHGGVWVYVGRDVLCVEAL